MSIVKIRTFNARKAKKHGLKLDWKTALLYGLIENRSKVKVWDREKGWLIDEAIGMELMRNESLVQDKHGNWWYYAVHTEIQFSETHGNLSFSATTADGCSCCRIKNIGYSHDEEYWDTLEFEVTDEQEEAMFREACRMADVAGSLPYIISNGPVANKAVFYGPKAIKYDKAGVFLSNIHPARIWGGSSSKVWCTEACTEVTNTGKLTNLVTDMQIPAQYHLRMMAIKAGIERQARK